MATKDKEGNKVKEDEILTYCQVPRGKREIMEYLGLKNTSHFEKNYLKVLLHDGRLQMTIPNKPTSGKQKYYAKKE
jgi:ATP-dependent DNA helicase RecG